MIKSISIKQRILFILLLFISSQSPAQISKIDSLNILLKNEKKNSNLIDLHFQLYMNYFQHDSDSALYHIRFAKLLIKDKGTTLQKYNVFTSLAEYYLNEHRYDSCLKYVQLALEDTQGIDPEMIITLHTFSGQANAFAGRYDEAVTDYLVALKLAEDNKLTTKIVNTLIDLGNVNVSLGNWEKTEAYYVKAEGLAMENKLQEQLATISGNLGMVYTFQEKWEEAIQAMEISKNTFRELKNALAVCKANNNLGVIYENKGDFPKALEYYSTALEQAISIDDKASVAIGYQNVGHAFSRLGQYEKARDHFQRGIAMSKSLGKPELLSEGLYNFSMMYEFMGDYKKALEIRTQAINLNDSILNAERLRTISELEVQYETEKKEKEILELNQSNLEKAIKIQQKNNQLQRTIIGSIVLILLLGIGFLLFRQKQQSRLQAATIKAITETQEEERKRIASDLHDSVGSLLSALKNSLIQHSTNKLGDKKELDILDDLSREVRHIAHNIMPATLQKFGLPAAIKSELSNIETAHLLNTSYLDFGMEERLEIQKEIIVYRIIQEVLQNTVKHAKAEKIDVQVTRDSKSLNLILEDNGVGFNPKVSKNGVGLTNIISRIKILNGKWNIDSKPGRGTLINISIPIQ